ncbi:MAG: cyclase family protein [Negativicutes bacterium]|jgi:arylformamidase
MIIDLTLPIRKHWRWPLECGLVKSFEKGDVTQVTRFELCSHWYTHVDSPRHTLPDGKTLDQYPLDILVGQALILDLSAIKANEPIDANLLSETLGDRKMKDILIIRTDWAQKTSWESYEYWDNAPYITMCGAEWIKKQNPKVVGFDFPQDYDIRLMRSTPESELKMPVHDFVLNNGVLMIEYLHNLWNIGVEECKIVALPLKLEYADGAPARVIAIRKDE